MVVLCLCELIDGARTVVEEGGLAYIGRLEG